MSTVKVQYEKVAVTINSPGVTGTSACTGTMGGVYTGLIHSLKVKTPTWASSAATACYLDVYDGAGDVIFTTAALANLTTYILTADRMIVTDTPTFRFRTNSIESTATMSAGTTSVPTLTVFLY